MADVNQRFPLGVVCDRVVAGDNGHILRPVLVGLLQEAFDHDAAVSRKELIDWEQVSLQHREARDLYLRLVALVILMAEAPRNRLHGHERVLGNDDDRCLKVAPIAIQES